MNLADPAKLKAQKTYNLASDFFDARPLGFWARYGRRTVERLALRPGARVLDVACGTGASALPAAEAVGPKGRVTGVDLAEQLLARGREKAQQLGLTNIEFLQADMTTSGTPMRTSMPSYASLGYSLSLVWSPWLRSCGVWSDPAASSQ